MKHYLEIMSEREESGKAVSAGVSADRPRTKIEEDQLGYRDFANTIAKGLVERSREDGLVIAIHGKWGAGKTTAVNMAVDVLERLEAGKPEEERTIVVRFNPWWFSEQKDLTRAFFTELTASIGKRLSSSVRDGLRIMAKKVSGASELVSSVLAWTPAGPAAKQVAELVKGAGEEIADERSLDEFRNSLSKALRNEARSIIVIIDDVDRLPADEARQIFRLVKSVADLPCVTYLLVFDREIAARGLEQPADLDSPEWLEKIIQVSFDLPPVAQGDLNHLFLERASAIIGSVPVVDQVRWGNTFHGAIAPWLRTARDVGRLANALAMTWPALRDEVDFADFIAIETMRLFEPKLYAFVRNHSERLTGAEPDRAGRDERSAFGEQLLANVEPDRRKRAERALCYLFPRLDATFANTWRGHDWARAEREHRITSRRRFPIYFSLGLGDSIVSADDLTVFRDSFPNPEATREIVRNYVDTPRPQGGTRAAVLLDAITSEIDTMMVGDQEQAARALLTAADLFLNPADNRRTGNGLPRMWAVSFAIEPFFRGLDGTAIAQLIGEAIDGPSPLTAAFFVTMMTSEHGRGGEKEAKPEDERRLSLEYVKSLEQRLVDRVARDAATGDLVKRRDAASLIWWWQESAAPAVRSWIDENLETEGFAPWLMATFTSEGVGQAMGDMVGQRMYTVNRDSLSKLVDVDRLSVIAERLIANGEDTDQTAAHFVAGLKSRY